MASAPSPDLNPIEKAYAKLKAYLRKLAGRTAPGLMALLEACADIFNPTEATNFLLIERRCNLPMLEPT